ncbi:MFS transporter [archaeon]|nr:MFS transporter [archaeon]
MTRDTRTIVPGRKTVASTFRTVFSNKNILAIGTTNMLYQVFNSLWDLWWSLYLITPVDEGGLGTPATIVGILATIQNTSQILFQLPGGVIADKIGRKKVIVFGSAVRTVAPFIMFLARSWQMVVPGIIMMSIASLYGPAFNALISESIPKKNRAAGFGAYRMFTSIPQIFMPIVGGYYFDLLGLGKAVRYGLLMFTVAMGIITVTRQVVLKETLATEEAKNQSMNPFNKDVINTFRRQPRTIYAMLAVAVMGGIAMRTTWTFLTPYAINVVGLTNTQYGTLQSLAMLISVPLYMISGTLADKYGRFPFILLARGLGPFDSLSLYLFKDYNQLLWAYGVIGFAGGLGGGRLRGGGYMGGPAWQALVADIVPSRDRAKVMGFMGTVSGVIGLPFPALGGWLYDSNPDLLLLGGSILEMLSIPIILFFIRDPPKTEEPDIEEIS